MLAIPRVLLLHGVEKSVVVTLSKKSVDYIWVASGYQKKNEEKQWWKVHSVSGTPDCAALPYACLPLLNCNSRSV